VPYAAQSATKFVPCNAKGPAVVITTLVSFTIGLKLSI